MLQVYDELVFEASEVVTLSVPLVVETGAAKNWDEAH